MSVLVFTDIKDGKPTKSSLEACSYASKLAGTMGTDVVAVATESPADVSSLGQYGVSKVMVDSGVNAADSGQVAQLVASASEAAGADVIVTSHDHAGKMLSARVAVRLGAGIVAGAVGLPDTTNGFVVKKSVFSGKAMADVSITTPKKVISIMPNSFGLHAEETSASEEAFSSGASVGNVSVKEFKPTSTDGSIPLPEADLVVSAGRGLKGPENWGMIEELAQEMGAATACSRPVSDIGWRPHHEHVGQTGIAIRPNLYIAVGISGAIQHLAGVNGSKTIVVINKDPEAPFFKAADYGIVGDAFDVVPKLIDAVKQYNQG